MECGSARRVSFYTLTTCSTHLDLEGGQFECTVWVNHRPAKALLDSGSMVTLVHARVVGRLGPVQRTLRVVCIHGDTREYPLIPVTISARNTSVTQEVGVVSTLIHDVIVGRDCPLFAELWCLAQTELPIELGNNSGSPPPNMTVDTVDEELLKCVQNKNVVTDVSVLAPQPELTPKEGESSPVPVMVGEDEEELSPVDITLGVDEGEGSSYPVHPDLDVSRGAFGRAQMGDPMLINAREQVTVVSGVPQAPDAEKRFPHFAVNNDLFYRVSEIRGEIVEQLLVPQPYQRMVLDLAHNDALGGHLGAEKTEARITDRFYWPGIGAAVKRYCSSCPVCQLTAPAPHYRNPLVPLPIIEVPFERIAMDIVGPLEKSARGHRYILVVLDYATRYPEAVPLRNPTSKAIARELFFMFLRTGLPREILTDQGTPFMSRVMADVCKLFQIKQLRTSVYHPQTDGLVERFNKTLKMMLKRVVQRDGRDWDHLLPALLFAIREVPQASTGFSPFELVYGRRPRGLLDLVKETWESESSPHKSLIEHISQMRERISKVMPLVQEHLQKAQEAQKRVYNRSAKLRQFQVGDRVAVLIPTVESRFLAKWQGPYEVVEKVGEVNYRVHQPGKRKPYQIYHINLLKPWRDREVSAMVGVGIESDGVDAVHIAATLSKPQTQEVKEFLQRNKGMFSGLPGHASGIKHDIVTEPHVKVRVKPYRIPEAHRKAVSEEVKKMLQLDVIEESQSEWSSPVVLVPKPNGTLRFCNDFRKLNEVSKFDAYPMPRVDELIEKLGPARYITTLDLTKGYWQIPLTKEAREKTAFSTPEGHFHYKRMPFGLHSAPATFQRAMDRVLRPYLRYTSVYLDDIVIFSPDWESHLPRVQTVLDGLRKAGFTVNPEKSAVGMEEAKYLGYVVGRGLVKPQFNKVEAIQNWPRPLTKKQVRAFLGIVGYYRRFV
uniref:Gypsy retrotransposon integrase-like protein 1 n=1 Tax=Leptobrachium leishanense TaxID=445787 RepID=A0A8C5PW96_9ANUR